MKVAGHCTTITDNHTTKCTPSQCRNQGMIACKCVPSRNLKDNIRTSCDCLTPVMSIITLDFTCLQLGYDQGFSTSRVNLPKIRSWLHITAINMQCCELYGKQKRRNKCHYQRIRGTEIHERVASLVDCCQGERVLCHTHTWQRHVWWHWAAGTRLLSDIITLCTHCTNVLSVTA